MNAEYLDHRRAYTLDQHFLDRPGNDEIQLDLFGDYEANVDNALTAVGFDRRAAVVIAMAVAGKTLVNTVAHLSQVEIDAAFKPMPTL